MMMFKSVKSVLRIIYNYVKYRCGFQKYSFTVKNMCSALADMNIFYVKFFQWFTETVNQNEPDDEGGLFEYFQQFKTNVPYSEADIDYKGLHLLKSDVKLELDLKKPPINSGTVALVFKGSYGGRPIVVKVLRVNIRAELERIYVHYEWLIRIIKWMRFPMDIDYLKIINDTRETCFAQLDFQQEVNNIALFKTKFLKNKSIVVPEVYWSSPTLIMMDYLSSRPLEVWTVQDYNGYAKTFTHFLVSSYFIKDIYHGDLHMGNLVFMDGGRIGLIDFGLVGTLNIDNQNFIYELFRSLGHNDYKDVVRLYIDYVLNPLNPPLNPLMRAQMIEETIHALEITENTDIYMLNHAHLMILFQTLHRHGLSLEKNMNQFMYSILSMLDTMKRLMSQEVDSHIINIFERLNRLSSDSD